MLFLSKLAFLVLLLLLLSSLPKLSCCFLEDGNNNDLKPSARLDRIPNPNEDNEAGLLRGGDDLDGEFVRFAFNFWMESKSSYKLSMFNTFGLDSIGGDVEAWWINILKLRSLRGRRPPLGDDMLLLFGCMNPSIFVMSQNVGIYGKKQN